MSLNSIGDGAVHDGGEGVLRQCGVYNGSNPSYFGYSLCGPAFFITRADNFLRVRIIFYPCVYFITRAAVRLRLPYTDMTYCYVKRLYYCFKKLIRAYKC